MKRTGSTRFGRVMTPSALAVVLLIALIPAASYAETLALILRQAPSSGGKMDPEPGLYYFERGTEVSLTASPKRGYKFIRWFGEVADATAVTTTTYLNRAKVVVAVFQSVQHRVELTDMDRATNGAGSPGGRITGRSVYVGGGGGGGVSYTHIPPEQHIRYIVIPEPGTILLVGICAALVRSRRLHCS